MSSYIACLYEQPYEKEHYKKSSINLDVLVMQKKSEINLTLNLST